MNSVDQAAPLRAAIYVRSSLRGRAGEQEIEHQIRECQALARERGRAVVETYEDLGWSAAVVDRPQLQQLLADAERGLFDEVIAWGTDRLGHSRFDVANVIARLDRARVRAVFANGRQHEVLS